jgi:hypothetical protein
MTKTLTPERIERGYKTWVVIAWVYRAALIVFSAYIIWAVTAGLSPWYLLYVAVNAAWFGVSLMWVVNARNTRNSQYRALELNRLLDEWERWERA